MMYIQLSPFLDTILTGVIAGVIAAFVFFLIMQSVKPRIKISDKICRTMVPSSENGITKKFMMKFYNLTWSNIEDVSIDLFLMEDYFNGSAKDFKAKRLNLRVTNFKFISGTKSKHFSKDIWNNCVKFTILDDLDKMWGKKDWLHLQITSYHATSGKRKVFIQKFTSTSCIEDGIFDSGQTFKIIQDEIITKTK